MANCEKGKGKKGVRVWGVRTPHEGRLKRKGSHARPGPAEGGGEADPRPKPACAPSRLASVHGAHAGRDEESRKPPLLVERVLLRRVEVRVKERARRGQDEEVEGDVRARQVPRERLVGLGGELEALPGGPSGVRGAGAGAHRGREGSG